MIEEAGFEGGEGDLGVAPVTFASEPNPEATFVARGSMDGRLVGKFVFAEPRQVAPGDRIVFELTVDFDDEATVQTVEWLPSGAIIAHPT